MTGDLQLLRQLYRGPTLTDEGERIAAQFGELSARPSVDGCDQMVRSLPMHQPQSPGCVLI